MGTVIGITGTPGTGKKSVAPLVAFKLGIPCIGLPQPRSEGSPYLGEGTAVDTGKLKREITRHPLGRVVAYGHLLPYVVPPKSVAYMIVLRCEPAVLKERLERRGYPARKVEDNVVAELIGLIADDAQVAFGKEKTVEFDTTTSSPKSSAKLVFQLLREGGPRPKRIDWTLSYASAPMLRSLLHPSKASPG